MTQSIILARQPGRRLSPSDFEVRETEALRALRSGEVRLRVSWLSIDPYQRGLLDATPVFGRRVQLGDIMAGRGIGKVVESCSDQIAPGVWVLAETGWSSNCIVDADLALLIDCPEELRPYQLGILGVPGMTAYFGLESMGCVDKNDVLLVSSAAGAVGSTVVQLAKYRGARVVGITSGSKKVALLKEQLGIDVVIDRHLQSNMTDAIRQAAPDGITCFFDNVGEDTLASGLIAMRPRGRAVLCGYISGYEADAARPSSETLRIILRQRLRVCGLLVHDHAARFDEARRILTQLLKLGHLQAVTSIVQGLENAPAALCDLLAGRSAGKVLVQLA